MSRTNKKHSFFFMLTILFFILLVFASLTGLLYCLHPKFGKTASGERLERIRHSRNFVNEHFKNEEPTVLMTSDKGRFATLYQFIFGKKSDNLTPKEGEIPVVHSDLKRLTDDDQYVWFGHSSFLLRLDGKNILVDPVFYQGSPVSFINKPFPGTNVYKPKDMPETIDYLVISHDHWDHLDYQTVKELQQRIKHVICPLGIGEDFEYWGFEKEKITEMDWNEHSTINGMTFHCLPTRHFSGRGFWNSKTLPASWLIASSKRKVFYTGDGGYSNRFKRFGEAFPDIDLAIMENGQYNTAWANIHTLPQYLGKEVKELGARRFVTVHHSKFRLAHHPWHEPRENEQKAAKEYDLQLIVCKIGEIIKL
ncbi:MAG: MBL fold metallo-hydrolase [Bacteroidales bacterium]|nr:MBL fold metallo-hydrolase [Bacteroidales bacterium]